MLSRKNKLPRGMSYPLQTSLLESAFREHGIDLETSLVLGSSGVLFECFFWPPNPNVSHERLYIVSGMVPSNEARTARLFMETVVIPEFVSWLQGILSQRKNSTVRRENQHYSRSLP